MNVPRSLGSATGLVTDITSRDRDIVRAPYAKLGPPNQGIASV